MLTNQYLIYHMYLFLPSLLEITSNPTSHALSFETYRNLTGIPGNPLPLIIFFIWIERIKSAFDNDYEKLFLIFLIFKNIYFSNIKNNINTFQNHCQTRSKSYHYSFIIVNFSNRRPHFNNCYHFFQVCF